MSLVECGVARLVLPGQTESGDRHLVSCNQNSVLIAAIDGIGHGENAASAAKTAASVLETGVQEPVISLVERCHERLRGSRGVVLSLAYVDMSHGMMTWLGVGNVQGVLLRAKARRGTMQEVLLLRGGVVGCQLPPLQASVLPISWEDTLVFATDGVRGAFIENLVALESPQRAAERILERYQSGNDDALVLVARLRKSNP